MNAFNAVMKVLAAAAVIAGAVFVAVVYGDKIMSFINKLLGRTGCSCCECDESDFVEESDLDDGDIVAGEQDFEG